MHTIVYLIRHGEVENPSKMFYGRAIDVPLSNAGIQQSRRLGRALQCAGLAVIYSSPLTRTMTTSSIISTELGGVPIIPSDKLLEVNSTGFVGKPISYLIQLGDYYTNVPEGKSIESIDSIIQRMRSVLSEIRKKYPGKSVGIVSHGDTLAFLKADLYNPHKPHPSIALLRKKYRLNKGDAWKITVDESGDIIEDELISEKRTSA